MIKRNIFFCGLMMTLLFFEFEPRAYARDLVASLGIIPPHSIMGDDGKPAGGFVEMVKAIDSLYKEGRIDIHLYPIARALNMVKLVRVLKYHYRRTAKKV